VPTSVVVASGSVIVLSAVCVAARVVAVAVVPPASNLIFLVASVASAILNAVSTCVEEPG
jgi:hypothetical protein